MLVLRESQQSRIPSLGFHLGISPGNFPNLAFLSFFLKSCFSIPFPIKAVMDSSYLSSICFLHHIISPEEAGSVVVITNLAILVPILLCLKIYTQLTKN